ncbi:flagellar filament capping protein FliD [Angustibacter peucedani]
MATTVDGLVSGLDTTTIINQLMQLQAAPQDRLKSSLSSTQAEITAFQAVNTKMASLQTAADKLGKAATWGSVAASSSSTAVTATATSGALSGSLTFSVKALAAAKASISSQTYTSTTAAGAITDTPLEIHGADGSLRATVTPNGSSLADVVRAINSSTTAGVTAAAVQVSPGTYRLQLTSKTTGTANDFSVTGSGGAALGGLSFDTATAAKDALVHVGDVGAGYDVTSGSNTVEGLMPGLTVKLGGLADGVTVQTTQDTAAVTSAVQGFVDAMNAALSSIKSQSSTGTVTAGGGRAGVGALAGEGSMRTLTTNLLNSITHGVGGKSLSTLGITTSRDGTVSFNSTKFADAMSKDPAGTQAMFASTAASATGVGVSVAALAKGASSSTGSIALSIQGRTSTINDLTKRISDWDDRLSASKKALQRQYSSLETALSKMQSQATWLNGQISSLG